MYIERGLRDYIDHPDYNIIHNHLKYKDKYVQTFSGEIFIEKGVQYRINIPGGYDLITDVGFAYDRSDVPKFHGFTELPQEVSDIIKSYALVPCSNVNIYLCASGIVLCQATTHTMPHTIHKEFDFNIVYTNNYGLLRHVDKHLVTCACSTNSELYFLIESNDDCRLRIQYTVAVLSNRLRTPIMNAAYIYDVDTNIQIQTGIIGARFSEYVFRSHEKIERVRMFDEVRREIQEASESENTKMTLATAFHKGL